MAKLFDRVCKITVQDRELHDLDVEFRIDRSLDPSQNTADIVVYNLSKDTRKHLSQVKGGVVVKLLAGYNGPALTPESASALSEIGIEDNSEPALIFLGKLRELTHMRDGADWITRISSGDGDEQRKQPVSFSLGPGADFNTAVNKIIKEMGVGIGNAAQAILQGRFKDAGSQFTGGVVVHGNSGEELRKMLASAQLDYSIQNGQLQVLPKGKALNTNAVLLNGQTGLVGSPEVGAKGKLKFRSLLNAQIYPGRKVRVESESVEGFYRVDRAVYIGQRAGNDWYVDCEAAP